MTWIWGGSLRWASLVLLLVIGLFPAHSAGMSLYRVGDEIQGESYNDVFKTWMKRRFSLWVGVETSGTEQLVFEGDTGLGEAHVTQNYTAENVERFERILNTAIEWSSIAKTNRADTSKALGCFSNHHDSICEEYGQPLHQNQMGLRFFSGNEGQQTSLIIDMIDQNNQFKKTTIYFAPSDVSSLLKNLRQLPAALKKAKDASSKQELFKVPGKTVEPTKPALHPKQPDVSGMAERLQSFKAALDAQQPHASADAANMGVGADQNKTQRLGKTAEDASDFLVIRDESLHRRSGGDSKEMKVFPKVPGGDAYLAQVHKKISTFWSNPLGANTFGRELLVVIKFRFHRNGTVTGVEVTQSSGNEYYDLAGKRALLDAVPLPDFPPDLIQDYLDASFSFSSKE